MPLKKIMRKLKNKFKRKSRHGLNILRKSKNGITVVFIHGLNSSRKCWRHENGSYWPKLLHNDKRFAEFGISTFDYQTGILSGDFSIKDIVDNLHASFSGIDHNLLDSPAIIFVAHSMGGIIARRFLVQHQRTIFDDKSQTYGLFLVGSPSLGSIYAHILQLPLVLFRYSQATILSSSSGNTFLASLNDDFDALLERYKEKIIGKELIEDHSIFLYPFDKMLGIPQIVKANSAGAFFKKEGERPLTISGSTHITIAAPENQQEIQHSELITFIENFLKKSLNNQHKTRSLFWNVPNYQSYCLPRPDEIDELKSNLFDNSVVRVTGMGGIGKSVLAAKIAHDSEVRQTFPGGIFWLTVGQEGRLATFQERLATALSDDPTFTDVDQGLIKLKSLFSDRTCLLILDDIWEPEQLKALNCVGAQGKILITTRNKHITGLIGVEHPVKVLTDPQAQRLLAKLTKKKEHDLPPEANEIVKECGGLPLALAMIGGALLDRPISRWKDILDSLQSANLEDIEHHLDGYDYFNLQNAMQVSVDVLERELYDRYLDFAVFPEDVAIPERVLEIWWSTKKLNSKEVRKVIDKLADRSLLQQDEKIKLHDLQIDFLRKKKEGEIKNLHQDWISAYRLQYPQGWHDLTDDGYCFDGVPYHLQKAEKFDELRELLLDFRWLQAKLRATSINQVLQDYDRLPEEKVLTLVRNSLRLSAHVLADDKQQLAGRLWGHLLGQGQAEILSLLEQTERYQSGVWLRPLTANLTSPDGPLLRILAGHSYLANSVAVLLDGKRAISASSDKTLKLWNLDTGDVIQTLEGHSDEVNAVAVLPDERAISASSDKTLKLWNLDTGTELKTLEGHSDRVTSVTVLPDRKRAISASDDKTLKLWNLDTGEVIQTLEGHSDRVTSVAVLSDGERAISAATVWPDGKRAISADGVDKLILPVVTLKLWDLDTGTELKTFERHGFGINSMAVLPDGKQVIYADGPMLILQKADTGEVIQTLEGHSGQVNSVAVLPGGGRFISASYDATLKLWDLETGGVIQTLESHSYHNDQATSVAVFPDGKRAISASSNGILKLWDLDMATKSQTSESHSDEVNAVTVLPDGKRAISASSDKTLKLWNLVTGEVIQTLEGHSGRVNSVAVLPDGNRAISASDDKTLKLWNLNTGEVKTLKGHSDRINSVAVLPDGNRAISASDDKTLKLWNLNTGEVKTLKGHSDRINSVAVLPDEQAISASGDKTLKLWNLDTGEVIETLEGDSAWVKSLAVLPGGKRVISTPHGRMLKLWDLETGKVIQILEGHSDWSHSAAVLPDGKRAISASSDQTLKLWDLETGEVIANLRGDCQFSCCTIAPNEVTIVAGDWAGRVHIFRLEQNYGQHSHRKDSTH
jgi:WD40 repeat protein/pimeloyl-ACP methyl ester carboxylesterase